MTQKKCLLDGLSPTIIADRYRGQLTIPELPANRNIRTLEPHACILAVGLFLCFNKIWNVWRVRFEPFHRSEALAPLVASPSLPEQQASFPVDCLTDKIQVFWNRRFHRTISPEQTSGMRPSLAPLSHGR